jgi:hypothetical protein
MRVAASSPSHVRSGGRRLTGDLLAFDNTTRAAKRGSHDSCPFVFGKLFLLKMTLTFGDNAQENRGAGSGITMSIAETRRGAKPTELALARLDGGVLGARQ